MTLVFSLLPEAGIILLLEFYDPNWVNFVYKMYMSN